MIRLQLVKRKQIKEQNNTTLLAVYYSNTTLELNVYTVAVYNEHHLYSIWRKNCHAFSNFPKEIPPAIVTKYNSAFPLPLVIGTNSITPVCHILF